ncbi:hypothetical protein ACFQZ2_05535, partial [Streptomonospora algeriensis]
MPARRCSAGRRRHPGRVRHLDAYYPADSSDGTEVDHDAVFSTRVRHAYPFAADLRTGAVSPLPLHSVEDAGIRLRVRLAPG